MTQTIRLLLGDSFKRIAELEPGSIIAVVTDPPYGISFMGKTWDSPELTSTDTEEGGEGEDEAPAPTAGELHTFGEWARGWLKLCYEKLPPGGVVKVFGATRTFHRMTAAMEKVGFEGLHLEAWVQGQGFPKSLDLAKAIDRCLGQPREVQGQGPSVDRIALDYGGGTGKAKNGLKSDYTLDGQARTTEAQKWAGWGTALKPSWEPFIVGRKP